MGREEHYKQVPLACVGSARSVLATLGLPLLTGMCAFPIYTAQALGCSAGNCLRWALGCMQFPGPSRSSSGSQVLHKGADLIGPAFGALPRSEQLRWPGARWAQSPPVGAESYLLPRPSHRVFWVYSRRAFSGMPCVSSGDLISGCDPPSRRRLSRIPKSLG